MMSPIGFERGRNERIVINENPSQTSAYTRWILAAHECDRIATCPMAYPNLAASLASVWCPTSLKNSGRISNATFHLTTN